MAEESNKKRKATSELPMREEAMLSPSNKSDLHTKIDVDSDEIPRLKKGTRSVTALRHGVRKNKLIANEFPPGIVQTVRVALFQQTQEPQCGANLVRNLCAHNLIPPKSIARELLDVIKFGPKVQGGRSLQTEVASSYACALVSASSRLVRRDGSAIFGPSTWDDVEVLLSQSTDRAMSSSGLLFAYELQMAACGAKLLSLLLKTELLDFNLSSADFDFNSESLRAKPTVAILKKQGLSNVLKTATRHTIKCLVRHAKWLLDSDIDMPPCSHPNHGQCCAAKTCLDSLGSVMCYTAWLFCAEERVSINHFSCAIIIRDVVLSELSLCDDSLPITNSKKKKIFITKLKLHFLLSLLEEFAFPMQDLVGKLIGVEDELDCFREETTKQEGDAVHDVGNVGRSSTHQLVRKSSVPVLVQRQNDLVEAYELENKDSSVFWVEYVSDGKCVPVSSDRIIRGRKRNPRPSRRPTYKVDPLLPTRMGKSSRFLSGEKISPLDTNIIREDLRQMEAYDKACKRFRIQSFLQRNPRPTKGPAYKVDPLLLSRKGKSSRVLTGEKITPLDTDIIQVDLRQMEAYDEARKRFRIQSFLSSNQESTESVQPHTKSEPHFPTESDVPTRTLATPTQIDVDLTALPDSSITQQPQFKNEIGIFSREWRKRRTIPTAMLTPAPIMWDQIPHPPAYAPCPPRIPGTPNHYPPEWTLPPRTYYFPRKSGEDTLTALPDSSITQQPQFKNEIGIFSREWRKRRTIPTAMLTPAPIMWDQIPQPPAYAPCPPRIPGTPNHYPPGGHCHLELTTFLEKVGKTPHS